MTEYICTQTGLDTTGWTIRKIEKQVTFYRVGQALYTTEVIHASTCIYTITKSVSGTMSCTCMCILHNTYTVHVETYSWSLAMVCIFVSLFASILDALSPRAIQCALKAIVGSGRGREKVRKKGETVGGSCQCGVDVGCVWVKNTATSELMVT